jgi:hypothetical protein
MTHIETYFDMIGDTTPTFDTIEDALDWMEEKVDDPCIDNQRVALVNDPIAMDKYEYKAEHGCCGSVDYEVIINNELYIIGCNYGH